MKGTIATQTCRSTICFSVALVHEPDDLIDDLAALEEHDGRNAAHHVAHRDARVVVDVQLPDATFPT